MEEAGEMRRCLVAEEGKGWVVLEGKRRKVWVERGLMVLEEMALEVGEGKGLVVLEGKRRKVWVERGLMVWEEMGWEVWEGKGLSVWQARVMVVLEGTA